MSNRRTIPGAVGLLAAASVLLTACGGGATVAQPTPLDELEAPAYRMQTLWQTDAGAGAGEFVSGFVPAVADGRVYVANRDGYVRALDLGTGETIFRSRTGDRLIAGPAVGDDTLLMGTRDGQVVALSATTGERKWTTELASEIIAPPAISEGLGVVRTLDGRVVALNLGDGRRRWSVEYSVPTLTMRGTSSPVIVDGTVYAGLDNGKIVALDLDNGEQRWEQAIALPSGRSELERIVDIDADPLVVGGELYAVSAGGRMASLSLAGGRLRWSADVAAETGLAYDDDNIFTADMDGIVRAFNRLTGSQSWQQDALEYRRLSAPSTYQGDVLVGDLEGYVHWLSADDGQVLARGRPFEEAIRARPVVAGDRVLVLGADGEIAAVRFGPVDGS
ncbi:outer membrane assembly protein YfgL [Salinisphaera orenii MK-B5]|uniref:Outer membrane protein assembly factor BamB n=1 Tax=Salinisphaera orenii MK-B5 TaxID=856730 RepID=A0A423PGK3_9GAMM|nr:outer membrane protein assembly factor BamB [Salinisphaera orenii]ROO24730.1 outer membrane assembly protein YfgL [Salinisphaera orenii MK-B5]